MGLAAAQGWLDRFPVHPGHHQDSPIQPVLGDRWDQPRFVKTELVDEGGAEGLHQSSVSALILPQRSDRLRPSANRA